MCWANVWRSLRIVLPRCGACPPIGLDRRERRCWGWQVCYPPVQPLRVVFCLVGAGRCGNTLGKRASFIPHRLAQMLGMSANRVRQAGEKVLGMAEVLSACPTPTCRVLFGSLVGAGRCGDVLGKRVMFIPHRLAQTCPDVGHVCQMG